MLDNPQNSVNVSCLLGWYWWNTDDISHYLSHNEVDYGVNTSTAVGLRLRNCWFVFLFSEHIKFLKPF